MRTLYCISLDTGLRLIRRLRSDLTQQRSLWPSWHRRVYTFCVQGSISKMALRWRRGDVTVPPEMAASAAEPPEVAVASASVPLWAMAPTPKLSVCPVTAKETVAELSACPVMASKVITLCSSLQSCLSYQWGHRPCQLRWGGRRLRPCCLPSSRLHPGRPPGLLSARASLVCSSGSALVLHRGSCLAGASLVCSSGSALVVCRGSCLAGASLVYIYILHLCI